MALLEIGHPGELFKEDRLEVNARVEIPHYLLSGLEAGLFDATGQRPARQPELTTRLDIRTQVYPADVFAKRTFSPYQQFVFDDIIPNESRVTDIINALRNAKFVVEELRAQTQQQQDPPELSSGAAGSTIDQERPGSPRRPAGDDQRVGRGRRPHCRAEIIAADQVHQRRPGYVL